MYYDGKRDGKYTVFDTVPQLVLVLSLHFKISVNFSPFSSTNWNDDSLSSDKFQTIRLAFFHLYVTKSWRKRNKTATSLLKKKKIKEYYNCHCEKKARRNELLPFQLAIVPALISPVRKTYGSRRDIFTPRKARRSLVPGSNPQVSL